MNIYRVLLEDSVNGEKFQFAIKVKGENQISSENLAQYGMTKEEGARGNAQFKALAEFPKADFVEIRLATLDELLFAPRKNNSLLPSEIA